MTLDCDVLSVEGSDLRIVVYTADPLSPGSNKLDLVRVIGFQCLNAEVAVNEQTDGA